MELRQYFSMVWKWWWLILLATVVAAGSSYLATQSMPRVYQAQATLMVGQGTQSLNPTYVDFYTAERLGQTYVQLATTRPVLQAAIDNLALETSPGALAGQVSASPVVNTQLLRLRVVDTDPRRAALIANGIAEVLRAQAPSASDPGLQQNRAFIEAQLKDLQGKIEESQRLIPQMQSALSQVTSARDLQDRQQELAGEQAKINTWRGAYASLLNFLSGTNTNTISIVEPAEPQTRPISPDVPMTVLVAGVIGFVLAVTAAFVLEYLDDTLKTAEDVQRVMSAATLGSIARISEVKRASDALISARSPKSHLAEAYRVLRTNVQFAAVTNPSTSLMVSSAGAGEGKSTTVANLGVAMAQAGKQVIVVDSDLRKPSLHAIFGLTNAVGLTNLLLQETPEVDSALQPTHVDGLRLLASGPLPPNPAELLGSPRMSNVIDQLKKKADIVLFDSPPSLPVADAAILSARVGEVVQVVNAGVQRSDMARRGMEVLSKSGAKFLGVVLNRMSRGRAYDYGYYSYYYYRSADQGGEERKKKSRWSRSRPRAEDGSQVA